jgi:hypothetical protein
MRRIGVIAIREHVFYDFSTDDMQKRQLWNPQRFVDTAQLPESETRAGIFVG